MQGINTDIASTLVLAPVIAGLVLGGPLTLYAIIKLLSAVFGSPRAKFVRLAGNKLGVYVNWDPDSYDWSICRVRVDATEMVPGGRSSSFSFTFEDKSAKKKNFLIPLNLNPEELALFIDNGLAGQSRALEKTQIFLEIESTNGESSRVEIRKKEIIALMAEAAFSPTKDVDVLENIQPDAWSVQTRVFPWRKIVATATAKEAPSKEAKKADGPKTVVDVDFMVTKVWIEPGCIVCDACENEAPLVFQVLPDTCIVREAAPLNDGAAIKAAAEGCPVNVIKYNTVPKSAAG
jgi:ferredoxin